MVLEDTIRKKFGYRGIPDFSRGSRGGHFSKWPPNG
jgi:hypothetical protein